MNSDGVITALCRISRKKPADIQPHLALGTLGVSSSFGLSALRSLLESGTKSRLPPLRANMQVSELMDLVAGAGSQTGGGAALAASPAAKSSTAISSANSPAKITTRTPVRTAIATAARVALPENIGMGMDMQEISALPPADDFRTHEFYAAHFSQAEIATAMLRQDARTHLCGLFCAKEALKKSHPELLNLRMSDILVSHDASGRPHIRLADAAINGQGNFRFILSITHTAQFAAATCLTIWGTD